MNIIVNGGTRGIGKEIVMLLSKEKKNKIIVTGRSIDLLDSLSSGSPNRNIIPCMVDLSVFDSHRKSFYKTVASSLQDVDILINTAGALIVGQFMEFSGEEAREIMETNFFGPATLIRTVVPLMKKGSHIVNISSMGGFLGSTKYKGLSYYSSSKAAVACLTECLAVEFLEYGISINCLALGSVQTGMFEEAFPGQSASVKAADMAKYIVDFAMNGSKFFNGKVLPVAVNNPV